MTPEPPAEIGTVELHGPNVAILCADTAGDTYYATPAEARAFARRVLAAADQADPWPVMIADDCAWCQHHGYTPGQQLDADGVPVGDHP